MDRHFGTVIGSKRISSFINKIDWQLLMFLLCVLQVKLAIKVIAIVLMYFLQPDFKFGFRIKNSRLPFFYPLIIFIAFVGLILNKGLLNIRYDVVFSTGIGFWALSILAVHQVKLLVEKKDLDKIHNTVIAFFILNTTISIFNFLIIVWKSGAINPYLYQGEYQKYFMGTGDYIKGITFDTSTTNAVLNAMGIVYFFRKRNVGMILMLMTVLLFTGSNFTCLLLLIILTGLLIFNSDSNKKSVIVVCILMFVIFWGKISPQNNDYVIKIYRKYFPEKSAFKDELKKPLINLDSKFSNNIISGVGTVDSAKQNSIVRQIKLLGIEDKPQLKWSLHSGERPSIPEPDINTAPYQQRNDTSPVQKSLLSFVEEEKNFLPLASNKDTVLHIPGKIAAFEQTLRFFNSNPEKSLLGDGIGNFSSKLAFRTTSLRIAGGYPYKWRYISREFLLNHFDIYLYFFSKQKELHSMVNTPDSVYDQMFSEYGFCGITALVLFYFGFFLKNCNWNGNSLPLIVLLAGTFMADYWFEQLSVVVFFELLMFININEISQ
jgi:hypothetical protein